MGQYFKPYIRFEDGSEEAYCSQNAIYKTVHGIPAEEELPLMTGFDRDDPKGFFNLFSGLKLLEHSWYGNDFVNGVMERIENRPAYVAWIGDYSNTEREYQRVPCFTEDIYEIVWPRSEDDPRLPEGAFPRVPRDHRSGCLVNHARRVFIDLAKYFESGKAKEGERWYCLHPLPLLTAVGNGQSGGDYCSWDTRCRRRRKAKNEDAIGSWAMDLIEFTEAPPPEGYREADYRSIVFDANA